MAVYQQTIETIQPWKTSGLKLPISPFICLHCRYVHLSAKTFNDSQVSDLGKPNSDQALEMVNGITVMTKMGLCLGIRA